MGDMAEICHAMNDRRKLIRSKFGRPCQKCLMIRPRGHAKILLPQQLCGYGHRDERPRITQAQWKEVEAATGIKVEFPHKRK